MYMADPREKTDPKAIGALHEAFINSGKEDHTGEEHRRLKRADQPGLPPVLWGQR